MTCDVFSPFDNVLVLKDQAVVTPDSMGNAELSDRLIVVVEGAQACANIVQDYYAKMLSANE